MIDIEWLNNINCLNNKDKNMAIENIKIENEIQVPPKQKDNVNNPSHYADGKIEVIDFIEDKKFNFNIGNAVKYISRAGKKDKNKYVEDLQKAIWYLNREIKNYNDLP